MQSIDALADALAEFEGGVVCISHDAQLLHTVCADEERAEVWLVEHGTVTKYDGYFDDYRESLLKEIADEMDADDAAAARAAAERAAAAAAVAAAASGQGYVNPLISNPDLLK
jgi:ATP-binding cassette subfamily F protein 1